MVTRRSHQGHPSAHLDGDHFDGDDDAAVDEGMKVFLPPPQAQPAEEPSKTQHYRKRNLENNFLENCILLVKCGGLMKTSEEQQASWSGGNTLSSQESQRPGHVTIGDIVSLMQIIIPKSASPA